MTHRQAPMGPSPHLTWTELACHDTDRTPYPMMWRESRAVPLAVEFERIRAIVGRPIRVLSGYRTRAYNLRVRGARTSQHVEGRALDLAPPAGLTIDRFVAVIRAYALTTESQIYGLGLYPTFVHIDIRQPPPHGRLHVWHGQRVAAEVTG